MKYVYMHIGLGSLGSYMYQAINTRFHPERSILIDPDVVKEHNIYNSAFPEREVGHFKVAALAGKRLRFPHSMIAKRFEDVLLSSMFSGTPDKPFNPTQCDIAICAVDTMKARKNVFEFFKAYPNIKLFIDLRGSKEQIRVYLISRLDIKFYEERFYPDDEVTVSGCEAVITSFNAQLCALMALDELKKYFLKESYRRELVFDVLGLSMVLENVQEEFEEEPKSEVGGQVNSEIGPEQSDSKEDSQGSKKDLIGTS